MDQCSKWMVTARLEKRALLIAANCLAGLAIFVFGNDGRSQQRQALHRSYGVFGYVNDAGEAVVTDTLPQGGIMSVFYLGTLAGCMAGGSIGDRFGRIKTIAIGAVWGIFGASLQCSAMNSNWMIGSRFVNGIGTGILNDIVPVWASELSEYASRGAFIAMKLALNILGVAVAYWLGYAVSFIDNGESAFLWRFPIAFQIIPLIFLLFGSFLFPESPRWLAKAERDEEALYILQRLRETSGSTAGISEAELSDIKDVLRLELNTEGTSYIHMLFGIQSGQLHTGRRVQLVIWLQIIQCWTGITGITMYGPTIFSIAGFGPSKALGIARLNNIFYTFATIICVFTIDRIGRRWTLYWGSVAQGIAMFLVGGLSRSGLDARANGNINVANQWGAAAASMVYVYTFIFGATWLTVQWLYPAEIFPLHIRAKGNAWGVVGWSIGNGTLALVLPYIFKAVNEKAMYIFGIANVISIPVVWALYPESNQRTLEKMYLLFAADTPWTWDAEKRFKELKEQNPGLNAIARAAGNDDPEAKDTSAMHFEKKAAEETQ